MRVAFIIRSSVYSVSGGDTVQAIETARALGQLGLAVNIIPANEPVDYAAYDLLHFFNLTRPADILAHTGRTKKPFVVSPIWIDYSGWDQHHRTGISGQLFRYLNADQTAYAKHIAKWLLYQQRPLSLSYLWRGQKASIREVLKHARLLLPNSGMEYAALSQIYGTLPACRTIPNGVAPGLLNQESLVKRDPLLVICAARIEGIKNQLSLIRALNGSGYELLLIGSAAPHQKRYYEQCRQEAGGNVHFVPHVSQKILAGYYQQAQVHVLPSWFETCGLSSLEAAALGCNIVVTDKGYTRSYFKEAAFYCDPASPDSIRSAIDEAAAAPSPIALQQTILGAYTWQAAAEQTLCAYKEVLAA